MNLPLRHLLLCSYTLSMVACEGPVGPRGEPGLDGLDGVANIETFVFTFTGADLFVDDDQLFAFAAVDAPEVTPDVVDAGVVLAYFRSTDEPLWVALPFLFQFGADDPDFPEANVQMTYIYADEEVGVQFYADRPFPFADLGELFVKVVVLPPADAVAGAGPVRPEMVLEALVSTSNAPRHATVRGN